MNFLNNNRWLAIIILLLLTANVVTLVYLWTHKNNTGFDNPAQPLPPPPPQGQVFEFVTAALQLDSAQQKAYQLLRDEHQAGQKPLQDSIRKAKDNFFALLQQAAPDSLIQLRSDIIAKAEQQLDLFTFKHFQQLRSICNTGQQNKFDSIIQGVLRRMAPGRMQQGPPPPQLQSEKTAPGKTASPDKNKEDFRRPPPRLGPDGRPLPPPPGMEGMPPPPPHGERRGPDGKPLPPPPGEGNRPPPGGQ